MELIKVFLFFCHSEWNFAQQYSIINLLKMKSLNIKHAYFFNHKSHKRFLGLIKVNNHNGKSTH